ncbi:hypothetical protein LX32DRAFT_665638 [Colletotrichum zoysiae]|uniref:BTB domain-containing protein n=1 Tax=Colletotrichum zoysiae TaxID=1216348 RepID=A0AAD9HCP1_9PEZI|nr:hypothetical protein LX32DRAFT_665638 [Colletotrichum zoysiae]
MDKLDVLSLWETKTDADVLLVMGSNRWQLHETVIRGKSGLVDHILDLTEVQNDVRKIALKEHAFTASALEATLKYFYIGDGAFDGKTEVIELLAVYDVSAALNVPALQQFIAPRIGNLLHDILSSRIDLIDDFIIAADVIASEEAEAWTLMRQELQKAISPHVGVVFSQEEFTNLVRTNQTFCFETLSTAIARMDILEKTAGELSEPSNLRDDGGEVKSMSTIMRASSKGALKSSQERATVLSTSSSMFDSDASIHWESCSEGGTKPAPRTQSTRASGSSNPAKLQMGTSTPSTISEHTIKQRPIASRVVERTRTPYASSGPSISQAKENAAPGLFDRTSRAYTFTGSSIPHDVHFSQTKEPATPDLFERGSRAYAFSGSNVPRDFHFSGATRAEEPKFTSIGTNPKYAQNNTIPHGSSRKHEARGTSSRKSGMKNTPRIDPITAHQIKRGKLVVEPTNNQLSASDRVLLDGPRIECNPS